MNKYKNITISITYFHNLFFMYYILYMSDIWLYTYLYLKIKKKYIILIINKLIN